MNQKTVIGVVAAVALVIASVAFSIWYSSNRQPASGSRTAPARENVASVPSPPPPPPPPMQQAPAPEAPIIWEGTYEPPPRPTPQYQQQRQQAQRKAQGKAGAAATESSLNAETLVGTAWQVDSPYGPVTVEFGANGQGVAMHSMVGTIPATWRIQGNKVVANASVMGQSLNIDATIQGETLVAPGQNIRRVR